MSKNGNLHKAKEQKNDEFYTQYDDIQKELNHYEQHFKGKTVLCNCDDPFESNFCEFFLRNFNYLGLKRLICTSYNSSAFAGTQISFFDLMGEPMEQGHGYVLDVSKVPMKNGRGVSDEDIDKLLRSKKVVKKLKGNGDFRSDECIEYLEQADVVVTNPPFSLFREYVSTLMEYKKRFIIIGNRNSLGNDAIFNLIQNNKLWIGYSTSHHMLFNIPNNYAKQLLEDPTRKAGHGQSYTVIDNQVKAEVNACWYTNCDISKRHNYITLVKHYSPEEYPHYDNYDAIEVGKTADIPMDYDGVMGVPITWLEKYNPEQFEIIGKANTNGAPKIKNKSLYTRILIRRKH